MCALTQTVYTSIEYRTSSEEHKMERVSWFVAWEYVLFAGITMFKIKVGPCIASLETSWRRKSGSRPWPWDWMRMTSKITIEYVAGIFPMLYVPFCQARAAVRSLTPQMSTCCMSRSSAPESLGVPSTPKSWETHLATPLVAAIGEQPDSDCVVHYCEYWSWFCFWVKLLHIDNICFCTGFVE